jgi:arylsulfatase A-like enzyme
MKRFYPLWSLLSAKRLRFVARFGQGGYGLWIALGDLSLWRSGARLSSLVVLALTIGVWLVGQFLIRDREPPPLKAGNRPPRPNLLLIGSDTLRADRLGALGYRRVLTPNLDRLAAGGALLSQCYVPCARTAPSLVSIFTGTWPHVHGVRDNFVADDQTRLDQPTLPGLLAAAGYRTAALADWSGADLGKFNLGFQELDVPADQWNLKFLLRQGPKDLRLFLSLFVGNRIGKYLLEEIYYLAGVPLTRHMGLATRRMLHRLGQGPQPFLLNLFMASTHPPFTSEYPYYTLFADPAYQGPSKFAMARLTDPFEIIRRQSEPREAFDLNQILDLYDGCVKSFDDEVGKILAYLERSDLAASTLVVVYSDHGMEFFEHGTWGQGNSALGGFSARVPVIFSGPQIERSVRLDGVTRTLDLAPTLLDLLGLPPAAAMEGVSLASALRGGPLPELSALYETGIWLAAVPGMPADHLRYPELLDLLEIPDKASGTLAIKPEYRARIIAAKDRMVRVGNWKLVYQPLERGPLLRLFNLDEDPGCSRDLFDAHPQIAQALWVRMQDWLARDGGTEQG